MATESKRPDGGDGAGALAGTEAAAVAVPDPARPDRTTSFPITAVRDEAPQSFFKEHGFLVLTGAVDAAQLAETVEEVQSTVVREAPDVDFDDPSTWGNDLWPMDDMNRGFLDIRSPYTLTEAWRNLQQPHVVAAFQSLLGTQAVLTKRPRYGVMRPTAGGADGGSGGRPEYATARNWLHWDQNGWKEPGFVRVQGLLTLSPHTLTSGGFECVPGIAARFKDWIAEHDRDPSRESFSGAIVMVPADDPMQRLKRAVTMDAGSLLLWDSRTAHASYPNSGSGFRMVQYVSFAGTSTDADEQAALQRRVREQLALLNTWERGEFPEMLSDLGRQVVGLAPW